MSYINPNFVRWLNGEALDESLEEHDKKYHGGHFDPKTMSCGKRDKLASADKSDDMLMKKKDDKNPEDNEIIDEEIVNRKKVNISGLGERDLVEVEGGYFHILDKKNPRKSAGWGESEEIAMMDAFANDNGYEGPHGVMDALRALPWEQKDEVAKMFRKSGDASIAAADFSVEHSDLDRLNRERWDSPENKQTYEKMEADADKLSDEANSLFDKYVTANGWKLGEGDYGDLEWIESK